MKRTCAMTSNRVYHKKKCPFEVIKNFEENCFGLLDTEYLLVFLKNIANTFLGNNVVLSDGRNGKVVFVNNTQPSRPIVKVGETFVDLLTQRNLFIQEVI